MPPTIQTRREKPTEPFSWRRIRPGVRKMPEPMTEPTKRRKRSRRRRVRRSGGISWLRDAWGAGSRHASYPELEGGQSKVSARCRRPMAGLLLD